MSMKFKAVMMESDKAEFYIFSDLCKGCGLCIEKCPKNTIGWSEITGIYGSPTVAIGHGEEQCNGCKTCQTVCPDCAIKIVKK